MLSAELPMMLGYGSYMEHYGSYIMEQAMTISEAQENLDEILDAIEADPTVSFAIVDDQGVAVACFVAVSVIDRHEEMVALVNSCQESVDATVSPDEDER